MNREIAGPPMVSVIICCYSVERLKDVREAVDSVLKQTCPPFEVVVAVDHTPEVFEQLKKDLPGQVKVVLNDGIRGLSETRNEGIRAARGDVLAFIDDDVVAAPDWLEKLMPHYGDPHTIAVGGKAVPQFVDGPRPAWFPEELDWVIGCTHKGPASKSNEVRNMIGCNMSFRKQAFEQAGLFDCSVGRVGKVQGMGEDTEICMRVKSRSPQSKILYEPQAVIRHKVPSWRVTAKYLVRRSYNEGLFKNTVQQLARKLPAASSAPESSYLKYLLLTAVPRKALTGYKRGRLSQAGAILLGVGSVGWGYSRGRLGGVAGDGRKGKGLVKSK